MKIFSLIVILVICPYLIKGIPKLGIVNGTPATEDEALSVVSIRRNWRHFCGGSIIGANWVMTAAHCFDSISENIIIVFGILATKNDYHFTPSYIREVEVGNIHIHGLYDKTKPAGRKIHDIALIQVSPRFPTGRRVVIISLPLQNDTLPTGKNATVLGWGTTQRIHGRLSNILMKCEELVNPLIINSPPSLILPEYQFYAGIIKGRGIGNGDSGGPLVYEEQQIGIAIGSSETFSVPDIFERVSYYRDWIRQISDI